MRVWVGYTFTEGELFDYITDSSEEMYKEFGFKPPEKRKLPIHITVHRPFEYENLSEIEAIIEKNSLEQEVITAKTSSVMDFVHSDSGSIVLGVDLETDQIKQIHQELENLGVESYDHTPHIRITPKLENEKRSHVLDWINENFKQTEFKIDSISIMIREHGEKFWREHKSYKLKTA